MTESQTTNKILFRTIDPTLRLDGQPLPAMTTLLYRVCDNDPVKFEEATRIVELFISEALNQTFGEVRIAAEKLETENRDWATRYCRAIRLASPN
jgi:hypothetical protein